MSRQNANFMVDPGWQVLFRDLGLSLQDLLRHASLPLDLFSRNTITSLTAEEYYRLFDGIGHLLADPVFPLRLGQSVSVEAFSPPIFACFCSANLHVALTRLAQYKPLICPMRLEITQGRHNILLKISALPDIVPPPCSVIATELVFLVNMARLATRERIVPEVVHFNRTLPEQEQYEFYFGTSIKQSEFNGITFSAQDAQKPFLTANEAMWSIFEPNLRMRMNNLKLDASFRERTRACFMEILASGEYSMTDVARKLGVSTRTLQRRLQEENTSFQQELSKLREELSMHYLVNSHYSSAEIAFLLGYEDPNSFYRAFHAWTGKTPEIVRTEKKI